MTDLLPRVAAPTLIIQHRRLPFRGVDAGWALASAISGARFLVIEEDMTSGEGWAKLEHAVEQFPVEGASVYPDGLAPREVEVLRLITAGRTNREISDELMLSIRTVARHITNIYSKIGARGKADAINYAVRHQLLSETAKTAR